jgi:hypothetical protein
MIASVDKARNAYHKKYAGYLPGDPKHKNLMIDSSLLGVTGTAKLIAKIVHQLYGESTRKLLKIQAILAKRG